MRFVPIDEVEQQPQQPKAFRFVPIEEANKQPQEQQPQALKFVPIENMPATPPAQTLSGEQDEFTRPAQVAPKENKVLEAYRAIHGDDEVSELKRAANSLHAGWDNVVSSWRGNQMSQAGEFIARLEEKFGKGAQNAPPDKQKEYKEAVDLYTKAAIDRRNIAIDQQNRYKETPKRQATQEFNAAQAGFDDKELSFLQSAAKAGEAFMSNPVGVATDIGLESLPATLASAAAAIFARYSLGSSLVGAGAGGMVSGLTEFGNEYAERRTKGEDHDQAWSNAAQKSGVIGLLDAVAMYSAGSAAGEVMSALTGTKRIGDAVKTTLKETGKQAALGAAGEAGGSLLIGETPNPAAVMAEAIGETVGAPLEGVANYRATKPTTIEDRAIAGLESLSSEEEPAGQRVEPTFEDTAAPKRRSLNELEQDFIDAKAELLAAKSRFDSLNENTPEEEQIEAKNAFDAASNNFDRVSEELNATWENTDFGFDEEVAPLTNLEEQETGTPLQRATAKLKAAEAKIMSDPNATVADFDAAQAEYDAVENEEKAKVERIAYANAQSAIEQASGYDSIQTAIEAYQQNLYDSLNEEGLTDELLLRHAGNVFDQEIESLRQAAQPKTEEVLSEEEVPAVTAANELKEAEAEADRIFDEDLSVAWNNLQNAPEERREQYQQQYDEVSERWYAATDRANKLRKTKNKPAFENIFIPPVPDNQRDQQEAADAIGPEEPEEQAAPVQPGRLPSLKRTIERINQAFQEGRITADEHAEQTAEALALHNFRISGRPIPARSRGADFIRQKLLEAKRRGEISERAADLAEWFILQNPALVTGLGISVRRARRNETNTAGAYNSFARIMTLIKNTGVDDTTVHEIFHHLERMMPREVQNAIRKAWRDNFRKAQQQAERGDYDSFSATLGKDLRIFFGLLNDYHFGPANLRSWTAAIEMLTSGRIPIQFYQYVNPSEFWAVNATNIMQNRYDFSASVMDRLRNWMREFKEKAKNFFGLNSKAPVIRAIDSLLRGDGRFQSARMLGEGALFESKKPNGWSQAEPVSAEEQKVQEQFRKSGELHSDVVEAINNNDINGALNLVANRFTGFYADLANRLAALNLQTAITFENARGIAQQGVLKTVGPELQRVMSYVRVANPAYYANYFEGFNRAENFTRVKTGLASIAVDTLHFPEKAMRGEGLSGGKFYYPAIANELEAVNNAYHDYGDVLYAQGAYINMFDIIVLNAKNNGNTYRVFLHEVVHAATVSLMRADPSQLTPEQLAAREEINKLYELAKQKIKTDEYGLKNKYEFVAELFTNNAFRDLLKKIPYPSARTNVLSRIYSAILALVGVENVASRAMVEAEKMFTANRYQTTQTAGPLFSKPKRSYKKGPITSKWRSVESLIKSKFPWVAASPYIGRLIWNIATGKIRIGILGSLELRHLSDLTKTKFPQIAAAVRIIEKMTVERGKIMTEAAGISQDWLKQQSKNAAQSRLLGRLMLETTLSGVEVDDTNTAYYKAARVEPQVKAAWDALHPEFKNIYRRVRDFYRDQVNEMVRTLRAQANTIQDPDKRQRALDAIAHDFGPDKLVFPYFPLKRFGDHWFQVGSGRFTEFYEFESYAAREVAFVIRKAQLLKGNAAQQKLAKEMEKGNSISQLNKKLSDVGEALKTVNALVDALSDQIVDKTTGTSRAKTIDEVKGELRDDLNQLIYTLLPQQSVRKMMINRKGTQGASEDMLRVFTNSAVRLAYQQARLKYSTAFLSNLQTARDYIDDMGTTRTADQKEVFRDFVSEVEKRYKPILGLEDTSTSAKIAGIASDFVTFMLMSAPISAALNTIGFAQLGATALGGKYGYIKATDRLTDNFAKYMGSTVERTLVPIKNGQVLSIQFPSAMESSKLKGLDKLAAKQLMDEEQVNVSQTYDLVGVGSRSSELSLSKYEAVKRVAFMPFHQLERFNREMLLLSAFQLEYEKLTSEPKKESNGIVIRDAQGNPEMYKNDATTPDGVPYSTEAYDIALGNAKDLAGITLGETTRQMRPRYFMHAIPALLLKFKRYAITAFYTVTRNFYQGVIAPFSKEEINQMRDALEADNIAPDIIDQRIKEMETFRKELASEGRKTLAGILGTTASVSGTVGLPIYSIVFPVLIKMLAPDDDDDEFFNWDNWYRNYMENEFGGYAGAMLTQLGMKPDSAIKLGRKIGESVVIGPISVATGGAFTERTSLDFKSLLFRDAQYFSDARDALKEFFMLTLGAGAGTFLTLADGVQLYKEAQYYRSLEKFTPAIINKPMTAYRYAQEGARTRSGELIMDDFTGTELAMQAIGLQPTRLAQKQKASIQAKEKEQKIIDKHDTIVNKLWMERNNPESFNKIFLDEAVLFNTKHPAYAITPKKLNESFKQRMKNQVIAESMGAKLSKPLRQELAPMLEYGKD